MGYAKLYTKRELAQFKRARDIKKLKQELETTEVGSPRWIAIHAQLTGKSNPKNYQCSPTHNYFGQL